MLMFTKFSATP